MTLERSLNRKKEKQEIGMTRLFCGMPAIVWQLLFFYVPLLFTFIYSFIKLSDGGEFIGFTLDSLRIFFKPVYFHVIGHSLMLALGNSLICLLIAYPLAYYMTFPGRKWKNILLAFLVIPFWTNFLLHIYAWYFVLEKHGFLNTLLIKLHIINEPFEILGTPIAIMLMMVYAYLPFMVLPLYSALEQFDDKLLEASKTLGATLPQTIRRILLPLTAKGIRTGFFLVFIPSFGEFAIPELMGGDKYLFVGNVVSLYMLGEPSGQMGSAFTLLSTFALVIVSAILLFLFHLITKRRAPHATKQL